MKIELGISTFGETTPIEGSNEIISHAKRIRNLIEEIELADQVGLDIYAIGEHHRKDFAVSNPETVLAAGAVNTKQIRLSSAVNVLSSADPVRLYQNYATVDALSNGRAEIMVGRGSFIESFPLFGYDLNDYEQLFDEKLAMLLEINQNEIVSWNGKFTQSIDKKGVYPRAQQESLPIWVGTGGNYESTIKIAQKGLPIAYAVIGGNPYSFARLVELYKHVGKESGYREEDLKVSAHSWGYIHEDKRKAIEDYFHPTKQVVDAISKDRSHWHLLSKQDYLQMVSENGAMIVGDVESVARKIIRLIETLKLDRFLLHLPLGSMNHEEILNSIRLYGEKVAPIVREYFEKK